MKTLLEIQQLLRAEMPQLTKDYHVESLGIFGSFIRNEQTPLSDVDLLVSFRQKPSLIKYIELENRLSELLDIRVDLVMTSALKPRLQEIILRQVIML